LEDSKPAFFLSKPEGLRSRLPALPKEILQNRSALLLQNAGCDFAPVIQAGHLQHVHHASSGAGNQICASKNYASDSSVNESTGAH